MWFSIVSLFPEMFQALDKGVTGKAIKDGIVQINTFNPREFTHDKHKSVDDRPYGGGPGMVMMVEPLKAALASAKAAAPPLTKTLYLSPQGKPLNQEMVIELAKSEGLILLAGRYEGVDERIIEQEIDAEISIGDYILTGGELAAMILLDATIRLLPGVVGDEESVAIDSFAEGLLKYPQYTRPPQVSGAEVPSVLLSGDHRAIKRWRLKASLGRTWLKRPDLLAKKQLSPEESVLLTEFIEEFEKYV